MENARFVALAALMKMDLNAGYSNIIFNSEIKNSSLSPSDISFCANLFYGVLEKKITLDYIVSAYSKIPIEKISPDVLNILRLGFYQLLFMDKVPDSAAVNECVILTKSIKKRSASGFVNGILRTFLRNEKKYVLPKKKISALKVKYSCPEWIIELFIESYGENMALKILDSLSGRPPINIRVNTLKTTAESLMQRLNAAGICANPAGRLHDALTLKNTGAIGNLGFYKEGLFHVQDLASQICCQALDVRPGQVVVDVCASPGGKCFTIAEIMGNRGQIFAFDLHASKVNLIKQGAAQLGVGIIEANVRDATGNVGLPLADRILCDVPCSGLGIMRRKPEIRYKDKTLVEGLPDLQYRILCKSCNALKIGGILVYSTCTLNPKENNNIADKFLKEHQNFEPVNLNKLGVDRAFSEKINQLTLLPPAHGTDGFFISAFRRTI